MNVPLFADEGEYLVYSEEDQKSGLGFSRYISSSAKLLYQRTVFLFSELGQIESFSYVPGTFLYKEIGSAGIACEVVMCEPVSHDECYGAVIHEMGSGIYGSIHFSAGVRGRYYACAFLFFEVFLKFIDRSSTFFLFGIQAIVI